MPKELFEETVLTCEALEKEAGLKPGSILDMTVYGSGAVEIESKAKLSAGQRSAVQKALAKHGLPKGKKPVALPPV